MMPQATAGNLQVQPTGQASTLAQPDRQFSSQPIQRNSSFGQFGSPTKMS